VDGLIALVLLLGAYGLGTVTKVPDPVEKGSPAAVEQAPVSPAMPADPPQPCRYADGPLAQRDLSVPWSRATVDREEVGDDGATGCADD
jgi:hypothetical protein